MKSGDNTLTIDVAPENKTPHLKRLARNTLFNFIGQATIILVAVIAIPILIRGMGTERFGVLVLIWSLVGYFSLFDLGLGRTLTAFVARSLVNNQEKLPSLIWTGFSILIFFGILGAATFIISAPWLIRNVIRIPEALQSQSLTALYLVSAVFPFVVVNSGFRGVLEGLQRFDIVNVVYVAFGIFSFAGTLLMLQYTTHLGVLAAVVIVGRFLTLICMMGFCFKLLPGVRKRKNPQFHIAQELLTFGSWITLANVVGPLMVYLDRFLIGAWISVAAVTYYTTPYDLVTRLWIIPSALVGALFPLFSSLQVTNASSSATYFSLGVKCIYISLFPITLLIVAFAQEGLTFWLDDMFAAQSMLVLKWLAVGVLINSLAYVPYSLIQGAGRPDLTTKLHLLVLPLYLVCVYFMIHNYGIVGAAIAWTMRVSFDTPILFFMAGRLFLNKRLINISIIFTVLTSATALLTVAFVANLMGRIGLCLGILMVFTVGTFRYLLASAEREYLILAFTKIRCQLKTKHA